MQTALSVAINCCCVALAVTLERKVKLLNSPITTHSLIVLVGIDWTFTYRSVDVYCWWKRSKNHGSCGRRRNPTDR